MAGVLYVVATPIGNLGDLTVRAREVLAEADLVAAEDTRHTMRLLDHYGLQARLESLHDHSSTRRIEQIVARVADGDTVALVSDAGTPLISDPGFELVRAAREADLDVRPVPGACAATAALSVAGLPTDRFRFCGFPPAKAAARERFLTELAGASATLVLYESSHRVVATLAALADAFGSGRPAFVAREMTKRFEQYVRGSLGSLAEAVAAGEIPTKGEFVLVVGGAPEGRADDGTLRELLAVLLEELPASRAARVAARLSGRPRKECFAIAEALRGG
ncbi:MAG: 16S rRNA (cytidine(1402)-2'-O)-methyltransferase [Pseudomonadota bacterium]